MPHSHVSCDERHRNFEILNEIATDYRRSLQAVCTLDVIYQNLKLMPLLSFFIMFIPGTVLSAAPVIRTGEISAIQYPLFLIQLQLSLQPWSDITAQSYWLLKNSMHV